MEEKVEEEESEEFEKFKQEAALPYCMEYEAPAGYGVVQHATQGAARVVQHALQGASPESYNMLYEYEALAGSNVVQHGVRCRRWWRLVQHRRRTAWSARQPSGVFVLHGVRGGRPARTSDIFIRRMDSSLFIVAG